MDPVVCAYCRTNPPYVMAGLYPICIQCQAQYSSPNTRACKRCHYAVEQAKVTCPRCNFTDLDLVEDIPIDDDAPAPPTARITWKCACGYTANGSETNVCASCGKSPFEERSIFPKLSLFKKSFWTCKICSFDYNCKGNCDKCGNAKDTERPQERAWTCLNCTRGNVNADQYCRNCGCGQTWSEFLEYSDITLNNTKDQWQCANCSWRTSIEKYECQNCHKTPKAVEDFLKKTGVKELTTWDRVKSVASILS